MDSAPITREEMVKLFGSEMPIEAVNLVWNSDGEKTCGELRAELRAIAAARPTADPGDDGELVERLRNLRVVLKSGDYDGADLMSAWCAMMDAADRLILYREARAELVKIIADAVEELKPFSPELDEADISEALYKRMTAVLSRSGG